MKVAVVSANLGDFDKPVNSVKQSVQHDFHLFTDRNFPPRTQAMTPRLQARIPKMFSWQMAPDYEYYLWVDSSCRLPHQDSIKWFLDHLGEADIAVFKHPHRKTVQEEADYIKKRLESKDRYITSRYKGERLDDQLAVVDPGQELYASTAFVYRNDTPARDLLTVWWLHTSLYHSVDQLSLPHAITCSGAKFNVIPDHFQKCKYLEPTRK